MAGVDPQFGLNSFNQAKYSNETETIAHAVLNLLFGKPGFFPSMPRLGINIQDTLYMFWDEISPIEIKAMIAAQCSAFRQYIDDGSLDVRKTYTPKKHEPLLLIVVPLQIKNSRENLIIGVTTNENGEVVYKYEVQKEES